MGFGGGSKKCGKCNKSVYHNDPQLALDGKCYHKSCARCATCNGYLSIKNFSTSGERLLCKTHFKEEFAQTGGVYAGDDKFKQSGSRVVSRCNSVESGHVEASKSVDSMDTSSSSRSYQKRVDIVSTPSEEAVEVSATAKELAEKLADAAYDQDLIVSASC